MELSNYRPESHVAQQSRRDKLRVHQSSQRLHQDYSSNLDQLSIHQGLNPDQIQASDIRYGNISYNPTMISSEMLSFAANPQVLLAQKDAMVVHQESSKVCGDPQNCGPWRSVGSQQNCDWTGNYSVGLTSGIGSHQNSLFVGEGSLSVRINESLPSPLYTKPTFNGYQDLQSSFTNPTSEISSQNSQKHYEEMHFNSPSFYQNTIPLAVATSGVIRAEGLELASIIDQSNPTRIGNPSSWIPRPGENVHHWNGELDFLENKSSRDLRTIASDSNTQGLSLSLSPILPHKTHSGHFGEDLHSGATAFDDHHGPKILKSDYLCSHSKACTTNTKILGNTGPLGPFTGYATILKSSKFLKPAQQLLDVSCCMSASKSSNTCEVSKRISNEVKGPIDDALNAAEHIAVTNCDESGVSSSTFYGLNENSGEGVVQCSFSESYQPEYQQKKAKLLFMQEEVSRRYKQYQQQMQMVVSSFETVAGLSSATPYLSLALKAVSRHFRCLKNAISDQLKHIRKVLGENFSTPNPGASSSKGDTSSSRLNFFDQSFMKQKSGGGNLGFLGPQQHVWRPQRGLPERSVAILRAWLFEHFLHPYPTDTDKHMLASQTGLSRNQVSNWFINARVRVWKPMVEEIHVLETKGLAEASSNAEGAICRTNPEQPANILSANTSPKLGGDEHNGDQWNQAAEKRSRVEYQIPASTEDTSFMGFMPYQRSGLGLEIGGLGAVSLTLGLRQSVEISAQQQQQFQQQEHQLRQHQQQHFGSQMVHDFVG